MSGTTIRAFSNPKYDYYRLTKDFGLLKAGTIFFHDPDDNVYGSISKGCLKNCYTPDGMCYGTIAGGSVILHYDYVNTDWFEKVHCDIDSLMTSLAPGRYSMTVNDDGTWEMRKTGAKLEPT